MNMGDMSLFQILCGAMLVFVLVWCVAYEWRRRPSEPTRMERTMARGWLLFRRVSCFSVGGFFLLGGAWSLLSKSIGPALFCIFIAGMAVWVGMYGGGRLRFMSDDRQVHAERKGRYGWRW
jgi:hypothetical protein